MSSARRTYYPDHLNPFGSDDEEQPETQSTSAIPIVKADDYPEYLSPFDEDEKGPGGKSVASAEDYDDSLNPFGNDEEYNESQENELHTVKSSQDDEADLGYCNPFAFEEAESDKTKDVTAADAEQTVESIPPKSTSPTQESLELPPVPLPRTKSLLKKEQAQKDRQQQLERQQSQQQPQSLDNSLDQNHSKLSMTSTNSDKIGPNVASTNVSAAGTVQKKKRNAPPVPINFKRQVSGSLDAIEKELDEIGDELAATEMMSAECQKVLKDKDSFDEKQFDQSREKFIECIKKKNSIVRRQKELMYRKRELKLDQIHSDIEYELRMIGNKQLSHRTPEDESREKVLLKKLVEIVEEKSDIVENLNKETACVNQDINDALSKLNLTIESPDKPNKSDVAHQLNVPIKSEDCDRKGLGKGPKLSKIATLLPKGGTLKARMRVKPKHLFKKCDSRSIER